MTVADGNYIDTTHLRQVKTDHVADCRERRCKERKNLLTV